MEEITDIEIKHMKDTFGKNFYVIQKDDIWIKAFEIYNQFNIKVRMGCRACYFKVLKFHMDRVTKIC